MFREGRVTDAAGRGAVRRRPASAHDDVRVDGEPLDPPPGLLLMLHKPAGVHLFDARIRAAWSTTCCRRVSACATRRCPPSAGSIATPAACCCSPTTASCCTGSSRRSRSLPKVYEATLAEDLRGDEAALFASGTLLLEARRTPLLPAELEVHRRAHGAADPARRPLPPGAAHVRGGRQPRRGAASRTRRRLDAGRSAGGRVARARRRGSRAAVLPLIIAAEQVPGCEAAPRHCCYSAPAIILFESPPQAVHGLLSAVTPRHRLRLRSSGFVRKQLPEAFDAQLPASSRYCARRSRPASGKASTARSTLSSRSRCRVG